MKIKDGYVLRKVADSGVVVSLNEMDCNHLMTVNQSGIEIWDMLQNDTSFDEIVAKMGEIYDADNAVIAADVTGFLNKLREANLLED